MVEAQPTGASKYFVPDKKIALIVGSSEYGELRKDDAFRGFQDLPIVSADMSVVERGLLDLKFQRDEIRIERNPDFEKWKILIMGLRDEAQRNSERGEKTLVFLYYVGHACMDSYLKAACNVDLTLPTSKRMRSLYPVEKQIRAIAALRTDCYFVVLLDCCREMMTNAMKFPGATRGFGDGSNNAENPQNNLIITFACAPANSTSMVSTLPNDYFALLQSLVDPITKNLVIPSFEFTNSEALGEAEHSLKTSR